MPIFSLIVATRGRTEEIKRLLRSLENQLLQDFEVIIVDQNDTEVLLPIIQSSSIHNKIVRITCRPGVSLARNFGMDKSVGRVIAFPDDDCWYPPEILDEVARWFEQNPSYEILSVLSRDKDGFPSGNGWFQSSCDLNILNVYRASIGYGYFIRAGGIARNARFDIGIGPGADTPYLGGEDTDFILTSMKAGAKGRYEAKWHVLHPRKDIWGGFVPPKRMYIYGLGMGFVLRKHQLIYLWMAFVVYDFLRASTVLFVGKTLQSKLWFHHGLGLVDGFLTLQRKRFVR